MVATVGSIQVELSTDLSRLTAGFASGEKAVTGFAARVGQAAGLSQAALGRLSGIAREATGSLAEVFGVRGLLTIAGLAGGLEALRRTIESVAGLREAAEKTGVSAGEIQKLEYSITQVGGAADSVVPGLTQFGRLIAQAATGAGPLAKVFEANGVALRDQSGAIRSASDLLSVYSDLVKNATSPQDRLRLAVLAFGRDAGPGMVNLLAKGSAGLRAYGADAERAGGIISDALIAQAHELDKEFAASAFIVENVWKRAVVTAVGDADAMIKSTITDVENLNSLFGKIGGSNTGFSTLLRAAGGDLNALKQQAAGVQAQIDSLNKSGLSEGLKAPLIGTLQDQLAGLNKNIGGATTSAIDLGKARLAAQLASGKSDLTSADVFSLSDFTAKAKPTVIPTVADSAAARAAEQAAKAYATLIHSAQDRIAQLQLEARTVGLTTGETAALTERQNLLNEATKEGRTVTSAQAAEIGELAKEYGVAAQAADDARQAQERFNQRMQSFGTTAVDSIDKLISGSETLSQVLGDVGGMLRKASLEAFILGQGPLAGLFGTQAAPNGQVGGLFASFGALFGKPAGTPILTAPAVASATLFHSGGVVGQGGLTRKVPAALFAHAPRYHSGVVLQPGERPAILQDGETVLPRWARNLGGGSTEVNVQINNHADAAVNVQQKQRPGGGVDLVVEIDKINADLMRTPGSHMNRALQARGLPMATTGR